MRSDDVWFDLEARFYTGEGGSGGPSRRDTGKNAIGPRQQRDLDLWPCPTCAQRKTCTEFCDQFHRYVNRESLAVTAARRKARARKDGG